MSELEQNPPRPSPMPGGAGGSVNPRLFVPPAASAADEPPEPPTASPPPRAISMPPPSMSPPMAANPVRVERAGEILVSNLRLSLYGLYKLEQEIGQLPGAGQVFIDILDNGQVVIHVSPGAEERVRQYLALIGSDR